MALMQVNAWSETLGGNASFDVILPQAMGGVGVAEGGDASGAPVLWLLHGATDDHTVWRRRSAIERRAAPYGLAVVTPAASLSNYVDMVNGRPYYSYLTEELPALCAAFFPGLSRDPDKTFVAGLSMGCYGAFRMAMSKPERFAAVGGFSAGNSIFNRSVPAFFNVKARNLAAFGVEDASTLGGTEYDLYRLAELAAASGKRLPKIFHACGTEDFAYGTALELRDRMLSLPGNPFAYEFHEAPGSHTWEFWDEWIGNFLAFTGLPVLAGAR